MAENAQWTSQVIADAMHRIERGKGVLENQLDVAAILMQRGSPACQRNRFATKFDRARVWLIEAGQHTRDRGLAAAALAHQGRCATRIESQGGIFYRVDRPVAAQQALAGRKLFVQMDRLQHWSHGISAIGANWSLLKDTHRIFPPSIFAA